MFPWKRILIPTDFSTAAKWVFDDAVRAAGLTGAEILILHVRVTRPSQPEALRFPADESVYEYVEKQELEVLRRHVERADENLKTRLIVRMGPDPADDIARTAVEEDADLIVMATHARHHVPHLLIGSTTLRLLSKCTVPILAVRYGIRKRFGLGRMLVVIENPLMSPALARQVLELASHQDAEIVFAACTDPTPEEAQRNLTQWRGAVRETPSKMMMVDSGRDLLRTAEKEQSEVIVLAPVCDRDGKIGGASEYIIRHTDRAVLVLPNRGSDSENALV